MTLKQRRIKAALNRARRIKEIKTKKIKVKSSVKYRMINDKFGDAEIFNSIEEFEKVLETLYKDVYQDENIPEHRYEDNGVIYYEIFDGVLSDIKPVLEKVEASVNSKIIKATIDRAKKLKAQRIKSFNVNEYPDSHPLKEVMEERQKVITDSSDTILLLRKLITKLEPILKYGDYTQEQVKEYKKYNDLLQKALSSLEDIFDFEGYF